MIEIKNLYKRYEKVKALDNISFTIPTGVVFGLLGTNGAGKSTLLNIMTGILKQDKGNVLIDGKEVYDKPDVKSKIIFLSDDPYYFPNTTLKEMKSFYSKIYINFDNESFDYLLNEFNLEPNSKIYALSKGMKKQAFIIMSICSGCEYIFGDEVFDGLDPIVAKKIKKIFNDVIKNRKSTIVLASHNLQGLEEICKSIALFQKGKIILSDNREKINNNFCKIQCVFAFDEKEFLINNFIIKDYVQVGKFVTMIVQEKKENIIKKLESKKIICYEILPLSLEEIFIYEVEKKNEFK